MGFGMATQLLRKGYKVRGFDAWGPTLERFKAAGGDISSSPNECIQDLEFCVCMVATADQADEALFGERGLLKSTKQGTTILMCSTVPAGWIKSTADKMGDNIFLVDCPVSGGATRAANGTLTIMASGSEESFEKAMPLLQAMSDPEKLYIVDGGIGAGSNMKMCHQVLATCQILAVSEAMGLAARLGLNLNKTREEILKSNAWSWMFEDRVKRSLDSEFKPLASAVAIILKDTAIITEEARRSGFPTFMASVAEQVYQTASARGYLGEDDSGVVRVYLEHGRNLVECGGTEIDEGKIKKVIDLLVGIHTCAAAEALCLAKHVGIDLKQLFQLASTAAGGSAVFNKGAGAAILKFLVEGDFSPPGEGQQTLDQLIENLKSSVQAAKNSKCPLYLGSQALNLAMAARRGLETGEVETAVVATNWLFPH